jgi:hypothetical protein
VAEAKVFIQRDRQTDDAGGRWVLDTGATNHMTGDRSMFAEFNPAMCGTVRFGDGSVVNIEGRGMVLFACKSGEHRALTGVYYILRLTANIISIELLDDAGSKVDIEHGVLRLFDPDCRLLAKVKHLPNRLYYLDLHIARPVCLTACSSEPGWL